jgi:uncharacterized protein involved in type VI secretion and phage assembly
MNFFDANTETSLESGGLIKGVAVAIVTQNKDDEGLCRVKVSYPWHDQRESYWARLSVPMAGKDRGMVCIPEIGDEVLVAFEREDLRFPYVLGALWNGQDKPPFSNDDGRNDRRTFQSRKKHYLLFNDGSRGVVELGHEKGRKITFDDDGFAVQDERGNAITVDSNSGKMTIKAAGQLAIEALSLSIKVSGTLELQAGATLTLRGALVNIN